MNLTLNCAGRNHPSLRADSEPISEGGSPRCVDVVERGVGGGLFSVEIREHADEEMQRKELPGPWCHTFLLAWGYGPDNHCRAGTTGELEKSTSFQARVFGHQLLGTGDLRGSGCSKDAYVRPAKDRRTALR